MPLVHDTTAVWGAAYGQSEAHCRKQQREGEAEVETSDEDDDDEDSEVIDLGSDTEKQKEVICLDS